MACGAARQDLLALELRWTHAELPHPDRLTVHRRGSPGEEEEEPLAHELRCFPNSAQARGGRQRAGHRSQASARLQAALLQIATCEPYCACVICHRSSAGLGDAICSDAQLNDPLPISD
jgi:hypothetical protein